MNATSPIAKAYGAGFVFESPAWRASRNWGERLGYSPSALADINHRSIALMHEISARQAHPAMNTVISGCAGPHGDGYDPGQLMSSDEARKYHAHQIGALAGAGADMVCAITMTNTNEAIGIVRAGQAANLPVGVSFTLEMNGRLLTGQPLAEAIAETDAQTGDGPAYYT